MTGCKQNQGNDQIDFTEKEFIPPESESDNTPIRVAIISVLSPTNTINSYRKIANYIGDKLNRPAILIQRKSYNEISNLIINGGADIALLTTGSYITHNEVDEIEAIALQQRMGSLYNRGYIVVNKKSNLDDLNSLQNKSIAFTDPISYSGYISVKNKLLELNDNPEHFFSNYTFTYNQKESLEGVLDNVFDAAAISSLTYESIKTENPSILKDLKIIGESEPMGTGPVVISKSLSDKEKNIIKNSFITMHEDKSMLASLDNLFIDRYLPFDSTLYKVGFSDEMVE
ncbi:substrate-binding domain-containing protein [Bacillus sp. SD088]|uniref:substrate-binding domain-containing protein n=1 Tax=Bacillus sp. SD088 TaxID=2782012 RepID=UPI001A96FF42|nr:PhnD/SsuA/transferrin family substrate-binding protein [Bacillus sp. SD088]MBO0995997.1 PhnD/SsuA/transferrin family substrate-binding protein [Bacillus sp. SD088]